MHQIAKDDIFFIIASRGKESVKCRWDKCDAFETRV
jgi:hypothetical protein